MRTVFNNSMTAHVWAQQNQEIGRNSQDSMSFRGPVFFSYRTAIAEFYRGKVLVSSTSYSNTTARHQSYLRRALSMEQDEKTLSVPGKWSVDNLHEKQNLKSLADYVYGDVLAWLRTTKKHKADRKRTLRNAISHYREIENALDFDPETLRLPFFRQVKKDLIRTRQVERERRKADKEQEEKYRIAAERRKRKAWKGSRQERQAKVQAYFGERVKNAWKAGRLSFMPGLFDTGFDLLRLDGDTIETSGRAEVPVSHAKRIWPFLERIIAGACKLEREIRIGHFSISDYDSERQVFKAGCHNIPASEILDIAEKLELIGGKNETL